MYVILNVVILLLKFNYQLFIYGGKSMNVFDFDKTIFRGDSTARFYFFCLRRHPKILFSVPSLILAFIKYSLGFCSKTKFKEVMYRFLIYINDIDEEIGSFWKANRSRIFPWYHKIKSPTDVIISASPEFLLTPICKELGVERLIASRVDKKTGKYTGENCYGKEKVLRYSEFYDDSQIDGFYSDSLSDTPLALLSKHCHLITPDGDVVDWKAKTSFIQKLKKQLLSREFITYSVIGCIGIITGTILEFLFSLICNPNVSFLIGYFINITLLYFVNIKITFKENPKALRYLRFCASYIPNFIIQNVCVIIFLNILGFSEIISYLISGIIGGPTTYIVVKSFALKK